MSTFEEIYRDTIHSSYYAASFILRDENLTTQVLKEAYLLAIRHMDMLEDADVKRQQDVMARIVSTKALEMIRTKDPVSYKAFYEADLKDLSYIDEENMSEWDVESHSDMSYKKAASRVATSVKLLAQPQSVVTFLHYYIGMGTIEIAAAMDVDEDVVKAHLAACNRKLLKDCEGWKKQRRIPADIEILPFLKWALEREKDRNHYAGPNLLEELRKERLQNQDPRLVTRQEQKAEVYKERQKEERSAKKKGILKPAAERTLQTSTEESPESSVKDSGQEKDDARDASDGDSDKDQKRGATIAIVVVIAALVLLFVIFRTVTSGQRSDSNNETEAVSSAETETTASSESTGNSDKDSASSEDTGETGKDDNNNSDTDTEESSTEETDESSDAENTEEDPNGNSDEDSQEEAVDPLDDPDAYIIPDSDSRYLTAEEVEAMDWNHLYLAINELYARRGRIFGTTNKVQKYFDSKTWYNGTIPGVRME